MKKQLTFETIAELRAAYTNDFREFTSCIDKYAGKTDPFLRWKLEHLDDFSICRALYDLEEEMYYFEEDHGYRPAKPKELTMLKREFYKRTGLKWSKVYIDPYDLRYSSYSSINSYTTKEMNVIEDEFGIYHCSEGDNNLYDDSRNYTF